MFLKFKGHVCKRGFGGKKGVKSFKLKFCDQVFHSKFQIKVEILSVKLTLRGGGDKSLWLSWKSCG